MIACGNHKTRKRPADNSQKRSQSPKFSLEFKRAFRIHKNIGRNERASTQPRFQSSVLGDPSAGNEVKLQLKIICWYNCLSVLCHLKVFKQIRGKKTDNIRITYLPILLGNNKSYVTVRIPSMKNSSTLVKRPSLFKVSGKSKIAAAFFIVFPVPSFSMVAT